jgi:Serine kinase of the HPr protein, regulates carbohydrate metabolism
MVINELYYKVAGHHFRLTTFDTPDCLVHYEPFIACKSENELFHLTVRIKEETLRRGEGEKESSERGEKSERVEQIEQGEQDGQIGNFADDTAAIKVYAGDGGGYIFHIAPPGKECCCVMATSADYRSADVYFAGDMRYHSFALDNCLMLLYAFASASQQTLMMHASVVKYKGRGYLFLGRSGTGKSTHSRLWLEHIEECELLNDDNPIVRFVDGNAVVYGSPWSGKTLCYKNESATIGAFVRLQQEPGNHIKLNSLAQAFAALKPSCSTAPWDRAVHNGICETLADILQSVNTYTLGCRPDREAAELCRNTIAK